MKGHLPNMCSALLTSTYVPRMLTKSRVGASCRCLGHVALACVPHAHDPPQMAVAGVGHVHEQPNESSLPPPEPAPRQPSLRWCRDGDAPAMVEALASLSPVSAGSNVEGQQNAVFPTQLSARMVATALSSSTSTARSFSVMSAGECCCRTRRRAAG